MQLSFIEQYSQFAAGYNWVTFNFLTLEVEKDYLLGQLEITIVVLGIGVSLVYSWPTTFREEIKQEVDKINAQQAAE